MLKRLTEKPNSPLALNMQNVTYWVFPISPLSFSFSEQISSRQCYLASTWVNTTHLCLGFWWRLMLLLFHILPFHWRTSTIAAWRTSRKRNFHIWQCDTGNCGSLNSFYLRFLYHRKNISSAIKDCHI